MREFFKSLGKKVQELLNKIFGKTEQYNSNHIVISSLSPEEHDAALEEIKEIIANTDWNKVAKNLELEFAKENSVWDKKELENLANITYPILPKHYWCKTLILTIVANQPYEYQSMDISQLEERGIAHFVIGRTIGFQEIEDEYRREKAALQERTDDDGLEWLRQGAETGLCSTIYGPADLYYYEELGYWDFE